MSLVLLVGSLLMVKSIVRIQKVDVGYETERVITLRMSLTGESYRELGRRSQVLGVVGVAAGLAGAIPLTQLLSSMLYEVSPSDPTVFIGVTMMLVLIAGLASYLPARRAANVDPAVVLRSE